MTKPLRFIGLWDLHFGWEKANVRGNYVTRPVHDIVAIRAATRFAEEWQPDALILGGDNINCGPVSHWTQGKPRLTETLRLKDELELLEEHVICLPVFKKCQKKIFHYGNHERWVDDMLHTVPGLEGMVEPHKYLQLTQRGWDIYGYGEVSKLGKLYFTHGDQVLRNGGGTHPAKVLVNAFSRNIRAGHTHELDAATQVTPIDRKDIHTGIIVPCLASRSPEYVKNNPTKYMNGFLWGTIWPDGNFTDHVMVINDGRFIYNGKLFDGRKK